MQMLLCLFLLIAVSALVTATSLQTNNCIVGCKCEEDDSFIKKLTIKDCDSPLALTKNVFSPISKKATALYFKNIVVRNIEKDAFDGFNNLEVVIIENSNIGSIDPSSFNLQKLSTLSFTKTTFGEVPRLNSSVLEELIFNNCELSEVPNLENLPMLNFLNLANNHISHIDEMAFAKAESLEEVTLTNNSITRLPLNVFVKNEVFNTLNVDYNPLDYFELNLTSTLEFLSIRHCKLTAFERISSKNLDSLSSLDLGGNQISILPIDAFAHMKDLNYLDLSDNKLVELDDDIFLENTKLDRVNLDNNNFESLPNFQTKTRIFEMYNFSCRNCSLKSVKNAFANMRRFVTLDLSYNQIEDIEDIFSEMTDLKEVNLSHNKISSIGPKTFVDELETLILSHNPLKTLDTVVFASLTSLKKLDVSNCNMIQLWSNRNENLALPKLQQLLAANNSLTAVTVDDLKVTPGLKLLDLQNNPLRCTPELQDLLEFLLSHSIYSVEQTDILKTHENYLLDNNEELRPQSTWRRIADDCNMELIFNENNDDIDDEDIDIDDDIDKETTSKDDYYNNNLDDLYLMNANMLKEKDLSLARASYILSVASVFILTALVVLTVAVAITLLILKRNKSFNMHNGNLPRLKIPLWYTSPGHKKHSGSVYKPLSEDLSGPRTPIINRYEFKQTPQVHNSTIP